jgi:thiol-disulfide isomerase/thioredoxin
VTALLLGAVLAAPQALAGEVDGPGVGRLVAARRGRPVVVSLWATWCAPCVKEFPELIALARARRDIAVLAVSIDDPESRAQVEAFVSERRPPFPVYLKAAGRDDDFIAALDREWSGVVPATLVYAGDGTRAALIEGEHARAEIEKALEKAFARSAR